MNKLLLTIILISGCSTYRPIIDTQGVDLNQYAVDLQQCQNYATQVSPAAEGATRAIAYGAAGAALGAIVGAFTGDISNAVAGTAGVVGLAGGADGVERGVEGQKQIIRNCMSGRGYRVLR